ncbi:MAG: ABC transporter permease [Tannerellaceae bacterium]|nr:ABC transporter permease [Tannerellaceae bacterium]
MKNLFQIKSYFKFLQKHRLYTCIELTGLSISFMFVILIAVYTFQELSTDRFQENKDRLYVVANQSSLGMAYKLADRLKENFPEIDEVCPMVNYFKKIAVSSSGKYMNADLVFTDSTFFRLFSFNLIEGDRNRALEGINDAVISETFARKLFPDTDPLGKQITIDEKLTVVVNGVMEDIRNSAVPYGDILVRINNIQHFDSGLASDNYGNIGATPIVILAKEESNIYAKTEDVLSYLKTYVWTYQDGIDTEVHFVPLTDVYFSGINGYNGLLFNQGSRRFVIILLSVSLVILIFAVINYVNLTVAQAGFRFKEMATRRLLGSSRQELFSRLIMESTLMALLSSVTGLFLAFVFRPYANNLLEAQLDLHCFFSPVWLLTAFLVISLTGIISGILPAIVISNAKPVEVVKGSVRKQTKMIFSKFFITFQNAITIALIVTAITMVKQIDYMIKAPLGYNTKNIIDIPVEGILNKNQTLTLGNELKRLPGVNRIAFSEGMPFSTGNNTTIQHEGKNVTLHMFTGDTTFVDMLGIKILKDNHLASTNGFYLSRQTFREMNLNEDAPVFPLWGNNRPIAGMVEDFKLSNVLFESRPILLEIQKAEEFEPCNIAVETAGDPWSAFQQIKECYERITRLEFNGQFIDQQIKESFAVQSKTSRIVTLFAGVAILLSLLGLLAMSTYFIQQRKREIAIRKVFGSDNPQILKDLISTFLSYVAIAFVLIVPFAWYFLLQWLSEYSYRISLNPWIFLQSGLFCLAIAFITVFWQSWQAANMNPVENIKTE